MAIKLAILKKKWEEVRCLTHTATKTSPTSYAAVIAFSSLLFPSPNLKRKLSVTAANSKHREPDLEFTRNPNSRNRNSKLGINRDVVSPNSKELIDENGWILVTRRRRVAKPKLNSVNKSNPKLKGHHADMFILDKCFRCLQKGHKSMNCKNLRRCFNCQGTDHLYKNCNSLPSSHAINSSAKGENRFMHDNKGECKQTKETNRQSQSSIKERKKFAHNHPSCHHLHKLKTLAITPNWQSMKM